MGLELAAQAGSLNDVEICLQEILKSLGAGQHLSIVRLEDLADLLAELLHQALSKTVQGTWYMLLGIVSKLLAVRRPTVTEIGHLLNLLRCRTEANSVLPLGFLLLLSYTCASTEDDPREILDEYLHIDAEAAKKQIVKLLCLTDAGDGSLSFIFIDYLMTLQTMDKQKTYTEWMHACIEPPKNASREEWIQAFTELHNKNSLKEWNKVVAIS